MCFFACFKSGSSSPHTSSHHDVEGTGRVADPTVGTVFGLIGTRPRQCFSMFFGFQKRNKTKRNETKRSETELWYGFYTGMTLVDVW